ncbi:MAG TPA: bifunctional 4-hydroxy-2-oxoglutarate aldolase/2-dehydro-3-deoxy-phosphogluconate aldolase [Steroidobacteraceae bacterium]|nr:bifunctional 4-hydroxy-2-oxoglutarate aldolase/2-dehydro-3-deoxy-phosphogluconate aldolase [Steroidobacteraceae bacterium]
MNIGELMRLSPVIAVLTVPRLEQAAPLARALARGGLNVLEVTLRTACALDAIRAMRAAVPEALVGAGTITGPDELAAAASAGASFGVTPGLTEAIVAAANRERLPLLPGVMTPTELIRARAAGFRACKLFPAEQAGGPAMLRALAGPFPDQLFCPTGGVTPQNAPQYLALANVPCVGGSWLAPAAALEARDWKRIERLAAEAVTLRTARP